MTFPSATDISIANQALGLARARMQKLTSFTSPAGPEADQIALNYTSTRDQLFRAHHWNFAKSTQQLTVAKVAGNVGDFSSDFSSDFAYLNNPPIPWQYEYYLPTDTIEVRDVLGCARGEWELVNDLDGTGVAITALVTNVKGAYAVITKRIVDPNLWDVDFTQAMIASLAAQIAIPLTGDLNLAKALAGNAQSILTEAKVRAANESSDRQDRIPDWIEARRSYEDGWWGDPSVQPGVPIFPGSGSSMSDMIRTQSLVGNGPVVINYILGRDVDLTLIANTTLSVINWPQPGFLGRLVLTITNTGAFNIIGWPPGTRTAGGFPTVTPGAGKRDKFLLSTEDGGATLDLDIVGQNYV